MLSLLSATGSELQRCAAAAEKLLSSSHMCVLCTVHVMESVDHNHNGQWPISVTSRDLHWNGDHGNPTKSAGIPQGWKLILWGSRKDEGYVTGLPRDGKNRTVCPQR